MTIKQRLFIQRYLKYGNATRAAFDTYNVKKRNSAGVIGSRLLRNVKVIEEINSISEAEKEFPVLIVDLLKDVLKNGNGKDKVEAIKIGMRLHGIY